MCVVPVLGLPNLIHQGMSCKNGSDASTSTKLPSDCVFKCYEMAFIATCLTCDFEYKIDVIVMCSTFKFACPVCGQCLTNSCKARLIKNFYTVVEERKVDMNCDEFENLNPDDHDIEIQEISLRTLHGNEPIYVPSKEENKVNDVSCDQDIVDYDMSSDIDLCL